MPSSNDWPPPSVLEWPQAEAPEVLRPRSTEADALRFADYLADEIGWMLRTTFNSRVLRDHDCTVCTDLVALADEARAERRLYDLEDVRVVVERTVRLTAIDPEDRSQYWQVLLVLERPAVRVLDEEGEQVDTLPRTETRTDLRIAAYDGTWYLLDWFPQGRTSA